MAIPNVLSGFSLVLHARQMPSYVAGALYPIAVALSEIACGEDRWAAARIDFRHDMNLVPSSELTLEYSGRVGVLTPPHQKEEVRKYFGDTVKAAAEFSYISLGVGMVLDVLPGT